MRIELRVTGVDPETLRRLLATCSQNREDFTIAENVAPRVNLCGPELFTVSVAPCSPSLAALLATVADGGKP